MFVDVMTSEIMLISYLFLVCCGVCDCGFEFLFYEQQFGTNTNKLAAELTYQACILQTAIQQQQQQQQQNQGHTQATPTGPPPGPPAPFNQLPFGSQGLSLPPMPPAGPLPPNQLTIPQSGKGGTSFNTQQISPNNTAPVSSGFHIFSD